jgi:hypothetical protein
MARSIIGDTAAASGKPAPRRICLPISREPADPIPTPECPRAIVVERDDGLFQIGLCDDVHGRFLDRAFAQAVAAKEARHLPRGVLQ